MKILLEAVSMIWELSMYAVGVFLFYCAIIAWGCAMRSLVQFLASIWS